MDELNWNAYLAEKLKIYTDARGALCPMDLNSFPFEPKRLFYVKNVPLNETRGAHAHRYTKQILICLKGKIEIESYDGEFVTITKLYEDMGIYLPEMTWNEYRFCSKNSIMLALASTEYDRSDYVLNKDYFKELVLRNKK